MLVRVELSVPLFGFSQRGFCDRHDETTVLDALQSNQAAGELLNLA